MSEFTSPSAGMAPSAAAPDVAMNPQEYAPSVEEFFPAPEPEYVVLEWTADSRYVRPRSRQYYSSQLVLVILFSILLFFFQQLAAIVLLWAVFGVSYILAKVQPESIRWQITTYGIRMQNQLILWDEMTRFWVKDTHGFMQVHIDVPQRVYRQLVLLPAKEISLEQVVVEDIVELLSRVLPYEEPLPNRFDKWAEWLEEKFPLESEPIAPVVAAQTVQPVAVLPPQPAPSAQDTVLDQQPPDAR